MTGYYSTVKQKNNNNTPCSLRLLVFDVVAESQDAAFSILSFVLRFPLLLSLLPPPLPSDDERARMMNTLSSLSGPRCGLALSPRCPISSPYHLHEVGAAFQCVNARVRFARPLYIMSFD